MNLRAWPLALVLLPGCTLVDQTTFNPEAGKRPTVPVPVAAAPKPPSGPPALLTLRMGQAGSYQDSVAKAVQAARARKPGVVFDVVQITAPGATPDAAAFADAASVARAIEAQGIPAARVQLLARPEADAAPREVRVYVR